jgi:hypothetical protein
MELTSQGLSKVIISTASELFKDNFNKFLNDCEYVDTPEGKWKNYDRLNNRMTGSMCMVRDLIANIGINCTEIPTELAKSLMYINDLKTGYLLLANSKESLSSDLPTMYTEEEADRCIKLTQNS